MKKQGGREMQVMEAEEDRNREMDGRERKEGVLVSEIEIRQY